jgi:hypothetical protein
MLIGGAIAGMLCGLIPLITGSKRGHQGLGLAGMMCCVLAGLLLGVIGALPTALIFLVIILSMSPGDVRDRVRKRTGAGRNPFGDDDDEDDDRPRRRKARRRDDDDEDEEDEDDRPRRRKDDRITGGKEERRTRRRSDDEDY